ncbi:MAG: histidinol dehydrogenase [Oscillospiraceae bacterium]|nr:histidinol dehydrogenase [Oscillospiraceae bacterium]
MIRIYRDGELNDAELLKRNAPKVDVAGVVAAILEDVRLNGDAAVLKYTEKFDGAHLADMQVSPEEIAEALAATEPEFLDTLRLAERNIREYHEKQLRNSFSFTRPGGVVMGQKVLPIARVGLYVPAGTAPYPSTVMMDVVPAKLAGCGEIILCTPCTREGKVNAAILAAAHIAGVDRIFKVGGAQAVAAMAYGTESIPRVDKIVGPGNAYVAEAKRQVYGQVAIDTIAGPSEVLVLADEKSDPRYVAADMLAQAEHDVLSCSVLVTDSPALAEAVQAEIEAQLATLERAEIARASIDDNGKIILARDLHRGMEIANAVAPEHLEICVDNPFDYLDEVKNAGSVFLGRNCPEPLGDYLGGTNHTLPTTGTARFGSPLSVDDFIKKIQYTYYPAEAFRKLAPDIARFAYKEGLTGHARSALIRTEEKEAET